MKFCGPSQPGLTLDRSLLDASLYQPTCKPRIYAVFDIVPKLKKQLINYWYFVIRLSLGWLTRKSPYCGIDPDPSSSELLLTCNRKSVPYASLFTFVTAPEAQKQRQQQGQGHMSSSSSKGSSKGSSKSSSKGSGTVLRGTPGVRQLLTLLCFKPQSSTGSRTPSTCDLPSACPCYHPQVGPVVTGQPLMLLSRTSGLCDDGALSRGVGTVGLPPPGTLLQGGPAAAGQQGRSSHRQQASQAVGLWLGAASSDGGAGAGGGWVPMREPGVLTGITCKQSHSQLPSSFSLWNSLLLPGLPLNLTAGGDSLYMMQGERYCGVRTVGPHDVVVCDLPSSSGAARFNFQPTGFPFAGLDAFATQQPCGARSLLAPPPHDMQSGGQGAVAGLHHQRLALQQPQEGQAHVSLRWWQHRDGQGGLGQDQGQGANSEQQQQQQQQQRVGPVASMAVAEEVEEDSRYYCLTLLLQTPGSRLVSGITIGFVTYSEGLVGFPLQQCCPLPDSPHVIDCGVAQSDPMPAECWFNLMKVDAKSGTPLEDGDLIMLQSKAFGRYCSISVDGTLLCVSASPSNASRNLFTLRLSRGRLQFPLTRVDALQREVIRLKKQLVRAKAMRLPPVARLALAYVRNEYQMRQILRSAGLMAEGRGQEGTQGKDHEPPTPPMRGQVVHLEEPRRGVGPRGRVDHAHYLRALEMQVDTGLSFNAIPKALKGSFAVMAPGQQLEVSIPCARSYGRASEDIALTVTEGQA
ncbi:hypothetical protein QJQ45_010331 [Haematococcus lacustris]|nr:hypothetical protein QJQ45_010331 [Haematococcus lacustris]